MDFRSNIQKAARRPCLAPGMRRNPSSSKKTSSPDWSDVCDVAESATVAQNDGAVSDGSASAADSATSCQWHHIGADAVISDPHSKSCCGPVAPAVAPVAPGVAPWLCGTDPHSKSCHGLVVPAVAPVAPGVGPLLYRTKKKQRNRQVGRQAEQQEYSLAFMQLI